MVLRELLNFRKKAKSMPYFSSCLNFSLHEHILGGILLLVFFILVFLFIWGRLRYDAVALLMLAVFLVLGFVSPQGITYV